MGSGVASAAGLNQGTEQSLCRSRISCPNCDLLSNLAVWTTIVYSQLVGSKMSPMNSTLAASLQTNLIKSIMSLRLLLYCEYLSSVCRGLEVRSQLLPLT